SLRQEIERAIAAIGAFDLLTQRLAVMEQKQLVSDIKAVRVGYDVYATSFLKMVELQHGLGLTPDTGLEGTLRTSVHQIEESLAALKDYRLDALMLTMRRDEKDFLLRHDVQYRDRFKQAAATFAEAIAASAIPASSREDIGKKFS